MSSPGDDRSYNPAEIIRRAVDLGMRNLHTMIPAKVTKVYSSPTGQKVDCQILVKQVTEDEEGERQADSWPVVPSVPVYFFGAGGFRITCPVDTDTTGMLIFSHRSLDKWLAGSGAEVDPELDHDHGLSDAVFLPGLKPFGSAWDPPDSGMSIGKDGGLQATFTDDLITLATPTGDAQYVALANLVKSRLDTIQASYDAHKHTETGGTTSVPDTIIGTLAAVSASKVKAE